MIIYDYIFSREGGILRPILDKRNHSEHYYNWRDGAARKLEKEKCEILENGNLKGFYYSASKKPSGKIAFIVHGYRSNHAETAGVWRSFYKRNGFDLFCPDNPAAGQSGGKYIGFDFFESKAALSWIDFLKEKYGEDIQIIMHGFSLGGASVIRMSDEVPDNVRFIIDDCGFTAAGDFLRNQLGILYEPIRWINKKIAGYDIKDTDVRPHLRREKTPILFAHGKMDKKVPFSMGLEMYTNCRSEKDCFFVDNADHMECYFLEPEGYEKKIKEFIKRYCRKDNTK